VRLAREIAMDHFELEEILKRYQITPQQWEHISKDRYFVSVLQSEIVSWNETNNTHERAKLKAAAVVEEWLPEAHHMLHARGESLAAKVGLATLLSKIAGMGATAMNVEGGGGGERFVININLGDKEMRLEKTINVIDNSELGIIEETPPPPRAIPLTEMQKRAMSGGGVKQVDPFLNPSQLVKKWSA
jgi:hypothetical protein